MAEGLMYAGGGGGGAWAPGQGNQQAPRQPGAFLPGPGRAPGGPRVGGGGSQVQIPDHVMGRAMEILAHAHARAEHAGRNRKTACPPLTDADDIPALVCDREGRICVNADKGFVKWFWLTGVGPSNSFPSVFSLNETNIINFTVPAEENLRGDFEIAHILSTSTGRFSSDLFNAVVNKKYQNSPISNNLMFGNSTLMGELAETIYVAPTTVVQNTVTNLHTAPNTIRQVAIGRRFLDYGRERMSEQRRNAAYAKRTHIYWMGPDQGPEISLGALGTLDIVMTVPSSADFLARYIMDDSTGSYNVQVFEGLSGRAIISQPIPAQDFFAAPTLAIAGFQGGLWRASGSPARIRDWTHLWKRSGQIVVRVTDTSGVANKIRLAMGGQLIYYNEPAGEHLTINESVTNAPWRRGAPLMSYGMPGSPC